MRGRYKRQDSSDIGDETADGAGFSPLPGETAAGLTEPDTPPPGYDVQDVRVGGGGGRKGRNTCSGITYKFNSSVRLCVCVCCK